MIEKAGQIGRFTNPVESDGLGLHFTLLDVDFVAAEDDWDILANANKIPMPVWYVLVGDSSGDIEHDDTALTVDVVSIPQTTELLLTLQMETGLAPQCKVRKQ